MSACVLRVYARRITVNVFYSKRNVFTRMFSFRFSSLLGEAKIWRKIKVIRNNYTDIRALCVRALFAGEKKIQDVTELILSEMQNSQSRMRVQCLH